MTPKSKALKEEKKDMKKEDKKYITAPSGRKFEITKSKSMGHHNIDFKHK